MAEPQASAKKRAGLLRLVRVAVLLCGGVFVVLAARELLGREELEGLEADPLLLALSFLPLPLAGYFAFLGWRALVSNFSHSVMPAREAFSLHADSQLARYTPGKVGLPAVRIAGAERVGVAHRVMASTLLVEVASWAGVGSLLGLAGVALSLGADAGLGFAAAGGSGFGAAIGDTALVLAALALLSLILLITVPRERVPFALRRLLGVQASDEPLCEPRRPLAPVVLPLFHLLSWACWFVHASVLALALGGSLEAALAAGPVLTLGIVLGFLTLLTPAGAGVREVLVTLGLTPLLGLSAAIGLGLLSRSASLLSDVLLWALGRWLQRRREP